MHIHIHIHILHRTAPHRTALYLQTPITHVPSPAPPSPPLFPFPRSPPAALAPARPRRRPTHGREMWDGRRWRKGLCLSNLPRYCAARSNDRTRRDTTRPLRSRLFINWLIILRERRGLFLSEATRTGGRIDCVDERLAIGIGIGIGKGYAELEGSDIRYTYTAP